MKAPINHHDLAKMCKDAYSVSVPENVFLRVQSKDEKQLSMDLYLIDEILVIVFKGTDHPRDFIASANVNYDQAGTTHFGILRQINKVVLPQLRNLTILRNRDVNNIFITGHSLGGALAAVLADVINLPSENLVTFGSMRVFKSDFKRERGIHYINNCDLIPALPPNFKQYTNTRWITASGIKPFRSPNQLFFARVKTFLSSLLRLKKWSAFDDHEMDQYLDRLSFLNFAATSTKPS